MNFGELVARWLAPNAVKPSASVYNSAATGRRAGGWNPPKSAINSAIYQDGELLRARARDAVRQNWAAANGVECWVSSAIGTGIVPRSAHPDKAVRETLAAAWELFSSTSDADGCTNIYGQQRIALQGVVEAGEVFARRRWRRMSDGLAVPLQIQLLESEHAPYSMTTKADNGNEIVMGIELDGIGRRVAYHLYRNHPDETTFFRRDIGTVRIPAAEILHVFRPVRPGQKRGITWLSSSLLKLRDIEAYSDATLVRKKLSSMVVWWMTEPNPDDPVFQSTEEDVDGEDMYELQPGSVIRTKPGEKPEMSDPVIGDDSGFMKQELHFVAAAMGITYEMLTGDLEGVNLSSIRAGILEFRRRCEAMLWTMFIHQFCDPVWRWFVEACAMSGVISERAFAADKAAFFAVTHHTPKWAWIDPLKDVQSEKEAIRGGLKSRTDAILALGEDPEATDARIAEDRRRADSLGLTFDTDAEIFHSQPAQQSGKKKDDEE